MSLVFYMLQSILNIFFFAFLIFEHFPNRMRCYLQVFPNFNDFFHGFLGAFFNFEKKSLV